MSFKDNFKAQAKKMFGKHYDSELKGLIGESTIKSIMQESDIGVSKAYKVAKALQTTVESLLTGVDHERRTYNRRISDAEGNQDKPVHMFDRRNTAGN
jgi:hypothetical protein